MIQIRGIAEIEISLKAFHLCEAFLVFPFALSRYSCIIRKANLRIRRGLPLSFVHLQYRLCIRKQFRLQPRREYFQLRFRYVRHRNRLSRTRLLFSSDIKREISQPNGDLVNVFSRLLEISRSNASLRFNIRERCSREFNSFKIDLY